VVVRLVVGWLVTGVALAVAGRRARWLYRLISSGQPAPGRFADLGERIRAQVVEVFGQRRLLRWSVPGVAHFFTFWGFLVLGFTIVEAWGALFTPDFAWPGFGRSPVLGFFEDFFMVAVLVALAAFTVMRIRQAPGRRQRGSRFYGSHTGAAWVVLLMIAAVILTLLVYRAAQVNTGHFPFGQSWSAFASHALSLGLRPLGAGVNSAVETAFILANIAVISGFLVVVAYSKHLHIALAPLNVITKRLPDALGPLLPMQSGGRDIDFSDPDEDATFGRGRVEDFTWKGMLDFATCTECGRCQSQCPAWNTGKPLSPKLVITDLRDHLFAKAPYLVEGRAGTSGSGPEEGSVEPLAASDVHVVPESGLGRVVGSCSGQASRLLGGSAEGGGVS